MGLGLGPLTGHLLLVLRFSESANWLIFSPDPVDNRRGVVCPAGVKLSALPVFPFHPLPSFFRWSLAPRHQPLPPWDDRFGSCKLRLGVRGAGFAIRNLEFAIRARCWRLFLPHATYDLPSTSWLFSPYTTCHLSVGDWGLRVRDSQFGICKLRLGVRGSGFGAGVGPNGVRPANRNPLEYSTSAQNSPSPAALRDRGNRKQVAGNYPPHAQLRAACWGSAGGDMIENRT
jgi:hypothetical protein